MKNIFKYILLVLIVAGTVVAYFSDVEVVEFSALAVAFVSAALSCVSVYKKSEKKDWKVILAIVLIAVGSFGLGLAGVAADNITKLIAAVGGVLLLIFGILAGIKLQKK